MQTFLPYPDFVKSAQCLDYRRLGKQRVEAKQILEINLMLTNTDKYIVCSECDSIFPRGTKMDGTCHPYKVHDLLAYRRLPNEYQPSTSGFLKIKWENHPAVLMWRSYENSLLQYLSIICLTWRSLGYKDTIYDWAIQIIMNKKDIMVKDPHWLGDERLHSSHRAALLAKDYEHYSQFGWKEQPVIDYYWPVTKDLK